jgi:anti-sigma regulatory factor (Ser/Thr protein kinase)
MSTKSRESAFRISFVGGSTLLVLAMAVFAVAVQARAVSGGAERSIQMTENLRIVSVARAEISIASRLAAADDQEDTVEASTQNALDTLILADTAIDQAAYPDLGERFDAFEAAVATQSELLRSGTSMSNEAVDAELATGQAFDSLVEAIRAEQAGAIDALDADNDLMNLIGSVATFMVAFVVPSAALYVFESLRNTPRRLRELELEVDSVRNRTTAGAIALQVETETLRANSFGEPSDDTEANIRRSLLRLDHLASANGALHRWRSEPVDVLAIAHEVRVSVGTRNIIIDASSRAPLAQGDSVEVALILNELARNALQHGSSPVSLSIHADGDAVRAVVADAGPGLPDVVHAAIFEERDHALRNNMASGRFGYGLYAARLAAESMGATLLHERTENQTLLTLRLPLSEATQGPVVSEGRRAA